MFRGTSGPASGGPGSWWRSGLSALAIVLVYACADYGLGRIGFYDGWKILWPLNGVTVALLLRRPRTAWPLLLLAAELGTGLAELLEHSPVGYILAERAISAGEVLIIACILPPYKSLESWLKGHTFTRFAAALVVGPGISGMFGAVLYHISYHLSYLESFDGWATADGLGVAAIMPLALAFRSSEMRALVRPQALGKTVVVLAAGLALCAFALSTSSYPLLWLILPTLLAVELALSFAGTAIAAAGVCFLAIYMATHAHGPFAHWSPALFVSRDIALQCFLGFQLLALFPASIIFRERRTLTADLKSSNQQLLLLASIDGLTGIANRRSLDLAFQQEWKRALRLGSPLGMLMVDVDFFKDYNDRYGHSAGDECLRAVAGALATIARRQQDTVARFGGEEFALLLPHTSEAGALHLAEMLRLKVQELQIAHSASEWGTITVSIGCATLVPTGAANQDDLLRLADKALYAAKRAGRNRVQGTPAVQSEPMLTTLR